MDFHIPEELRAVCEGVREFVERRVLPLERQIDEEDRVPASLLNEAQAPGLFGLSIPEEPPESSRWVLPNWSGNAEYHDEVAGGLPLG